MYTCGPQIISERFDIALYGLQHGVAGKVHGFTLQVSTLDASPLQGHPLPPDKHVLVFIHVLHDPQFVAQLFGKLHALQTGQQPALVVPGVRSVGFVESVVGGRVVLEPPGQGSGWGHPGWLQAMSQ